MISNVIAAGKVLSGTETGIQAAVDTLTPSMSVAVATKPGGLMGLTLSDN